MNIYNSSIGQWITRIFNLKGESIEAVDDIITPTIEIKPIPTIFGTAIRNTSGTSTLYTTPLNQDIYVSDIILSCSGDAAANPTQCEVYANVGGVARRLAFLAHAVGVAGSDSIAISFQNPIKLDKNTQLSFALVYAAGVMQGSVTVYMYSVDSNSS